MTYNGRVKNGVIKLDKGKTLPDGARVKIIHTTKKKPRRKVTSQPLSLYERLKPLIGKAKGLPADMSVNLDHYLYGLPKRK